MKVGLIGYGNWGRRVARSIARVATLHVIADLEPARQAEAADHWAPWGARIASEADVAFAHCDAVWIATPTASHGDLIARALEAGRHVLAEKPVVRDPDEAIELASLAADRGLVLMGGYVALFTGPVRRLVWMRNVRQVTALRHNDDPSIADGDVLWGLAPHDIAAMLTWMPGELPVVEHAHGNAHRFRASLVWPSGEQAHLEVDWLAPERRRVLRAHSGSDQWIDLSLLPDEQEPLLAEAQHWVRLCRARDDDEMAATRRLVTDVTEVIDRIERAGAATDAVSLLGEDAP